MRCSAFNLLRMTALGNAKERLYTLGMSRTKMWRERAVEYLDMVGLGDKPMFIRRSCPAHRSSAWALRALAHVPGNHVVRRSDIGA